MSSLKRNKLQRLSWKIAIAAFERRNNFSAIDAGIPPEFKIIVPKWRRCLAEANYHAGFGRRDSAVTKYIQAYKASQNRSQELLISLGAFLAKEKLMSTYSKVWQDLQLESQLVAAKELPLSDLLFAIDVGLALGEPSALRSLEDVYLRQHLLPDRLSKRHDKTLLSWHVPKCGGTSLTNFLSKGFYKSGIAKLPSYHTPHVLRHLVENHLDEIPFLSAAHLGVGDLGTGVLKHTQGIVVLRDPVKRAMSAWRQYNESTSRRLEVLPQHGAIWKFWPTGELADFALRCPANQLNKLTWTFSSELDAAAATQRIQSLDHVIKLPDLMNHVEPLRDMLAVAHTDPLPTSLNATKNRQPPLANEMKVLQAQLSTDLNLWSQLYS